MDYLQANLLIGDARSLILQVHKSGFQADAIFLDPFSPPQCPQLWTLEFIQKVSECLHENGLMATYSCAAAVRTALLTAGLVKQIKQPADSKQHERNLIQAEGKPVSQTIIEERR